MIKNGIIYMESQIHKRKYIERTSKIQLKYIKIKLLEVKNTSSYDK